MTTGGGTLDWLLRQITTELVDDHPGRLADLLEQGLAIAYNQGAAMACDVGEAAFERNPYQRDGWGLS